MLSLTINRTYSLAIPILVCVSILLPCDFLSAQDKPVLTIEVAVPHFQNRAVAFSPDGNYLMTGGSFLTLWNARTGRQVQTIEDNASSQSLRFSPVGNTVAAAYPVFGGFWVSLNIWNLESNREVFKLGYNVEVTGGINPYRWIAMAFSPDGRTLLTGDNEGLLVSWDMETGIENRRWRFPGITELVWLGFLPDGKRLLAAYGSHAGLIDLENDRVLYTIGCMGVSLQADGKRFVANAGGTIRLHNTATGEVIRTYYVAQNAQAVGSVAISPDGKLALVGYVKDANPQMIFDANTGELLRTYPGCSDIAQMFLPDGKRFMTVEGDNVLHIWDISDLAAGVRGSEKLQP